MTVVSILTYFSAISFLIFGVSCFTTAQMRTEFLRYGLGEYRRVVGGLQLLGGLGLFFGYYYNPVVHALAAAGLCILMFLGFMVRIKIRDSFFQAAPSFIYGVLNAIICFAVVTSF